jgi:hypothetical protein
MTAMHGVCGAMPTLGREMFALLQIDGNSMAISQFMVVIAEHNVIESQKYVLILLVEDRKLYGLQSVCCR